MPRPKSTSPARLKRLGAALRALRVASDLTAEQVAKDLGWSGSKVSRIETGGQLASPDDVRKLAGLYGVSEDEIEKYVTIARQARQRDWWHKYDDVLPEWFEGYLGLEAEASKISTYESDLVPGLLQTEQYASGVLSAYPLRTTPEEMERAVDLRRDRQARLTDSNPLTLDAVISETVLRRSIGSATVMREQLEHLITMTERANITLRLLPFTAGQHPGLDGAFSVLEFPDPDDGRIVTVETMTSTLYIEKPRDIGIYRLAFDQIRSAALGPEETTEVITATARELGR
ncbi:MAG TPA: helix-turn-helix transcriptional regulator [Pseudonocardiaceae bacterium]|nr:helix-turn-helix transcriptional regulator [Pseudonocardiaceae bacterium]